VDGMADAFATRTGCTSSTGTSSTAASTSTDAASWFASVRRSGTR
jgi:hypothetical protein